MKGVWQVVKQRLPIILSVLVMILVVGVLMLRVGAAGKADVKRDRQITDLQHNYATLATGYDELTNRYVDLAVKYNELIALKTNEDKSQAAKDAAVMSALDSFNAALGKTGSSGLTAGQIDALRSQLASLRQDIAGTANTPTGTSPGSRVIPNPIPTPVPICPDRILSVAPANIVNVCLSR